MAPWKKILIIASSILILLVGGRLFLKHQFFSAFAPPKIRITTEYISTNRDFINGLTIEKINVDSLGQDGVPAKYTVIYWTSCSIDHPKGRPPAPPDRIYFDKKGKYWWTEEKVEMTFVHKGSSRRSLNKKNRVLWSLGSERFPTCPLEFEKERWYFIRIGDPQVIGIFFFIDKEGKEHQYYLASGVSPI